MAAEPAPAPQATAPPPPPRPARLQNLRVYYINLEHQAGRNSRMQAVLAKHGLAGCAHRVEALTPQHPAVLALLEEYPGKRPGQTACAQSHISVWERVVRRLRCQPPPPAAEAPVLAPHHARRPPSTR